MHLSKLEEANLIISQIGRESCVGRPQRLYQRNPELVEFHLPPRDYRFLCELLLGLIARSGKITNEEIDKFGRERGRSFVRHRPQKGIGSNLEIVGQWLAEELSYFDTNVELIKSTPSLIEIQNRNCIFKEAAEINPSLVCNLHQAVVKGMLDTVLSGYEWETYSAIVLGEEVCRVRISVDGLQE
jgi:predicted ArsR family transcriptional regulator